MEPDPALAAVKTYDYLRIALAALVLLLYTAIVLEWWAAGRCLQPSISAYYYTPVHAVLIGVLVTMGVCLVALKGNTDGEDVLMNLAGMLAPGVAFIPTPTASDCSSAPLLRPDIPAFVGNNMPALFFTGAVVGAVAVMITLRQGGFAGLSTVERLGAALTVVVLGGGIVWFVVDRESFIAHGHAAAAVPMFLAIIGVVWLNARDVQAAVRHGLRTVDPCSLRRDVPDDRRGDARGARGDRRHQPRHLVDRAGVLGRGRADHALRRLLGGADHRALEPRAPGCLTSIVGAWPATSTCTRSTRSHERSPRRWPCCARAA